jgi:uncharacterized protein YaaN involved in tellurite resistance
MDYPYETQPGSGYAEASAQKLGRQIDDMQRQLDRQQAQIDRLRSNLTLLAEATAGALTALVDTLAGNRR